eukprot:COSAG02_NODE_3883_length_6088_cov_2.425781_2_plen_151_part_00
MSTSIGIIGSSSSSSIGSSSSSSGGGSTAAGGRVPLRCDSGGVPALVFIGLLANVAVFLAIGALRILAGARQAARLPSHTASDSKTIYGQQGRYPYSTVPDYRKQRAALERTRRSKDAAKKSEHALGRSMMLQFAINEPLTGPAAGTTGT